MVVGGWAGRGKICKSKVGPYDPIVVAPGIPTAAAVVFIRATATPRASVLEDAARVLAVRSIVRVRASSTRLATRRVMSDVRRDGVGNELVLRVSVADSDAWCPHGAMPLGVA